MPPRPVSAASAGQRPTRESPSEELQTRPGSSSRLSPTVAFFVFLTANTIAAFFSPIQDCDEVFNYWEPTHYLNHGYGLQTWEYSPEYAIRSWAYAGIHALVMKLRTIVLPGENKVADFYCMRLVFALVCASCQARMCSTVAKTLNPRIAIFFSMIMTFSPGMYHASIAYLPSSFAMYTTMLGFSAFMDWRSGPRTAEGVSWFALGSLLGWPFAGALVVPFVIGDVIFAWLTGEVYGSTKRLLDGAARSLAILVVQVAVDSFFYRKLVCVPLNIVLYNVFGGSNKGPNIYGVEPWTFYILNLVLNFNVWFLLAVAALPLVLAQHLMREKSQPNQALLRAVVFVSPFYLWVAIFTLQPHKEERFMYPAYPALALNAAMALHVMLAAFSASRPRLPFGWISPRIKLLLVGIFLLLAFNLGLLRIIGTMTAFSSPLTVYGPLQQTRLVKPGANVCLGKEWYRFPSSYHLPSQSHAKFIKSEFRGLLPGEFSEKEGRFAGSWTVPAGMNDENKEDPGKYTDRENCNFLVDSRLPSVSATSHELDFISDTDTWEKLSCTSFMDASRTWAFARIFYVPDLPFIPLRYRRVWGEYCLLRRKLQNHEAS